MAGGRVWGTLFFLFMTFASFTTVVAVFENIIASAMELFHIERRRACVLGAAFILLASVPCVLGFNLWSGFQPLGAGSTVLDGEDFIVSNLLLPFGSLVYLLFCVTKWGWGFDRYLEEANAGEGFACRARAAAAANRPADSDRADYRAGIDLILILVKMA